MHDLFELAEPEVSHEGGNGSDWLTECKESLEDSHKCDDGSSWLTKCEEGLTRSSETDNQGEPQLQKGLGRTKAHTSLDMAFLTSTNLISIGCTVKLFNSCATLNMTPHRALLTNFTAIPPNPISAANKHLFNAIGLGDLKLEVPNGKSVTNIILKEVLYTPDITMTLIAMCHIDQAGHCSTFQGEACTIHGRKGYIVGCIPLKWTVQD